MFFASYAGGNGYCHEDELHVSLSGSTCVWALSGAYSSIQKNGQKETNKGKDTESKKSVYKEKNKNYKRDVL